MDAQLDALHTSVAQLRAQNRRAATQASKPAYFTNAVLNPTKMDILDLIRDADAFEASLFVATRSRFGEHSASTSTAAPEPPKPAMRTVPMPTPLKQPQREDSDARTYLLAAEKLLHNYHTAPRARKHIRMLLKRDGELQRHTARYQATIEQAERAQQQQQQQSTPRTPQRGATTPRPPSNAAQTELERVKAEIQREKMEIVALESMLADLSNAAQPIGPSQTSLRRASPARTTPQKQTPRRDGPASLRQSTVQTPYTSSLRQSLARRQAATPRTPGRPSPAPAPAPRSASTLAASTSASPAARRTLRQSTATSTPTRTTPHRREPALGRSVVGTPTSAASPRRTPTRALAQTVSGPPTPASTASTTQRSPVRRPTTPSKGAKTANPSLVPHGVMPPVSDELERITAMLWRGFGESMRYAAPGCASASYAATFGVLRALEQCAPQQDDMPSGDAPNPTSPLPVMVVMMAHVLLLLMRSPAPHTLSLPAIKTFSEKWWKQQGQPDLQAAQAQPATRNTLVQHVGLDATEGEQTGEALATRAVYGLVAKKLLRIQRAGGAANVRFA